jgi:hypothetical protein
MACLLLEEVVYGARELRIPVNCADQEPEIGDEGL